MARPVTKLRDDVTSYQEPFWVTLARTGTIALVVGALLAWWRGGHWLVATLLVLWPSFGGHWLELWFLNWLRPRLPSGRTSQTAVRILVWFVGGIGLAFGMRLTAMALRGFRPRGWAWWLGGVGFIGVELVVHLVLQVQGRPSFYNGRG